MNKYIKAVGESTNQQAVKKHFLPQETLDEELRKRIRRAVKNVSVPADLETKILNFLRKKV